MEAFLHKFYNCTLLKMSVFVKFTLKYVYDLTQSSISPQSCTHILYATFLKHIALDFTTFTSSFHFSQFFCSLFILA